MRSTNISVGLTAIVIVAITMLGARAVAQQEVVLHNFGANSKDGIGPTGTLISDSAGNLYGTTTAGGAYGGGTVFEFMPKTGGGWTQKVLHNFNPNSVDGQAPLDGLIFDASGNLYGTTEFGGPADQGTVFELLPQTGGGWAEKQLHTFSYLNNDGVNPFAGLVLDGTGNLYGMTPFGGTDAQCGTVFELTPRAGGIWAETLLLNFSGAKGCTPFGGLTLDTAGNLYGTTLTGGPHGSTYGVVFELTPQAGGGWAETVLNNFNNTGTDCCYPYSALTFDSAGNLYGATEGNFSTGIVGTGGTVFELKPTTGGTWIERVLYTFSDNGDYDPVAGVIFDPSGNLYGTTYNGGAYGYGAVYELRPTTGGRWTEKVLHSFNANGTDGQYPYAGLILDSSGNLYGTTFEGGLYGGGVLFAIKP